MYTLIKLKQITKYSQQQQVSDIQNKIQDIDHFNRENGLMSSYKQVLLRKRNEPYIRNINKFIEPLNKIQHIWTYDSLNILSKTWTALYDNNMIEHDFLDDENWIYQADMNLFKQKYYLNFMIPQLERWTKINSSNFFPLFNTIKNFKDYNISNYSATSKILTPERNNLANKFNIANIKS